MDAILSRVTQHAMNYAIRSGVTIATGYTIKQCGRLLQQTPRGHEREQIAELQVRLETKIRIISPAIDMIELISARGNTSLESAVILTRSIRLGIQELGVRLNKAVEREEHFRLDTRGREAVTHELLRVIAEMKILLQKIDDAVPLVNLAITTSGASLSSRLSTAVSPSRLLQASAFLTSADAAYGSNPQHAVQVGPTFVVSLYMLFASHSLRPVNETGVRDTTWKEVIHKAHVKLVRLPLEQVSTPSKRHPHLKPSSTKSFRANVPAAEYAYQLTIVEDLDDDRVHTFDDDIKPQPFDGVDLAGVREILPVHEVAKIFYADTGKILSIQGDSDEQRPVLLLKRDEGAEPPRRMAPSSGRKSQYSSTPTTPVRKEVNPHLETSMRHSPKVQYASDDKQFPPAIDTLPATPPVSTQPTDPWRFPPGLDPEWVALEVYAAEATDEEEDSDDDDGGVLHSDRSEPDTSLLSAFAKLGLPLTSSPLSEKGSPASKQAAIHRQCSSAEQSADPPVVKTTLSLLEMLIKLAALQQFRQESHLAIEDELLNLFLQETATAGSGENKARRQRIRHDALQRVGFDPYDESPIKMRSMPREKGHQAAMNVVGLESSRV